MIVCAFGVLFFLSAAISIIQGIQEYLDRRRCPEQYFLTPEGWQRKPSADEIVRILKILREMK